MNIKIYPKPQDKNHPGGFTAEDVKRGLPWIYADVTCPHCGKEQPVAGTGFIGGPCCRCGQRTDGASEDPLDMELLSG